MKIQKNSQICDACIEKLLNQEVLSEACEHHIVTCKSCKTVINTMSAVILQKTAYSEDFSGVKQRLLKKLVPMLSTEHTPIKTKSALNLNKFIPWLLSFTVVGAMMIMFATIQPKVSNDTNNLVASKGLLATAKFQIAINHNKMHKISLDEPVTLSKTDTAIILIPDGSELNVKGPARLNINPRGFHLVEGFLIAKVKKGKIPFISTTPQGQIRVLGTIYTCKTSREQTLIKLIQGSVKIIPDYGSPMVLKPGESSLIKIKPTTLSTKKDNIPPINKE